jgi:hypothetical protein
LPLGRRHLPQLAECPCNHLPPVGWQASKLRHRSAHLLPLLGIQVLHLFRPLQHMGALLRIHGIQLRQPISYPLLRLRRELVESGLVLQRSLLILGRKILMAFHPLRQMLLTILGPEPRRLRDWTRRMRSLSARSAISLRRQQQ